jgi:2-amino-4-hydroxy-6-hydroxymethyldihydropteridine diphosphokinase
MPKLKKSIGDNLSTIKTPLFPKKFQIARLKPKREGFALLGIGGNIGDVVRRFEKLLFKLNQFSDIKVVSTSIILKNPPFGYERQDDFFNSLILIQTSLSPENLLRRVLAIEDSFGRRRSFKNAPRTLDIDIIFFDQKVIKKSNLIIPHPFWRERKSILIPLKYMQKELKSKKVSKIIQKLLTNYKNKDIIPPQIKR